MSILVLSSHNYYKEAWSKMIQRTQLRVSPPPQEVLGQQNCSLEKYTSESGLVTQTIASLEPCEAPQGFVSGIHYADVEFPTQYCLTATNIFSGTRGPSSWSTILVSHLIPPTIFLTLINTSTSSRNMTAPSGRKILSISRRMSSQSHLHMFRDTAYELQKQKERIKETVNWSIKKEEIWIRYGWYIASKTNLISTDPHFGNPQVTEAKRMIPHHHSQILSMTCR